MLRKGLFHCGGLQSRGVKQENSADEPCFNVLTCFDGIIQFFQAQDGLRELRARTNSKKNLLTKKMRSSTVRRRPIPRGAVESLMISD